MNILRSYLNWWHNWQLKNRRRSHTLKGSHSMGKGRIFLKSSCLASFKKIYRLSLISTGSISPESTLKENWYCMYLKENRKQKAKKLLTEFTHMAGNGEQQLGKADTEQQHRTGVHCLPKPASNKNKYRRPHQFFFYLDFAPTPSLAW